jgi:hypothetical protein
MYLGLTLRGTSVVLEDPSIEHEGGGAVEIESGRDVVAAGRDYRYAPRDPLA